MEPLVSVIMPSFNSERFIREAIRSVQLQTLDSWELLVTDDCSTDSTVETVEMMTREDRRVRLFCQERNSGAAAARNRSLSEARGRYVAFLDADDIWYPEKLEHQVSFMEERKAVFSCCSYEIIGEDGAPLGRTVHMLDKCDYMGFLTHNLIQTVGVMVDLRLVDEDLLLMPHLRRCEDAATWMKILKSGHMCYGINEILCGYRRVGGSLSSGKLDGARSAWNLYRNIEKLSLPLSLFCFARYASLAIWKRMYIHQ